MPEREDDYYRDKWNAFLATGAFEEAKHPEEGYQIGELVTGRDGINYVVQGVTGNGELVLGTNRSPEKGKQQTRELSYVRPVNIGHRLIRLGLIEVPDEKRINARSPQQYPGKKAGNN